MKSIKEKQNKVFELLKSRFGYTNKMTAPRIDKVVVSVGTGKMTRSDKKRNEFIADRLSKITGQKPSPRGARKSIASFKLRQGEPIGLLVTLRGRRMHDFLDRLFNIVIPRIRDFRGIERKSVDETGNLTIGIRENNAFPETADEELKDVFGLAVTIATTAKTRDEGLAFFEALGVPLKKT